MIKGIVFDLDGVYFVKGKENFIKSLGEMGVTEDEVKRVFLKSDQMNKQYKCGLWTDSQYWSWAAREWGLNGVDFNKFLIEGYELNEPVTAVIKDLRKKGYKTLICSNNFPARVEGLQERFGFLDDFDAKVFSYEVGSTKPAREIFDSLIVKSGLRAEEIAYADDNPDNAAIALIMGINGFLYDGFELFIDQLRKLGVEID